MTEAKIKEGYRFVVYELDKGFNGIILDLTVNKVEDLFTDQYLFTMLAEVIVKLEMNNYGVAVLAKGVV